LSKTPLEKEGAKSLYAWESAKGVLSIRESVDHLAERGERGRLHEEEVSQRCSSIQNCSEDRLRRKKRARSTSYRETPLRLAVAEKGEKSRGGEDSQKKKGREIPASEGPKRRPKGTSAPRGPYMKKTGEKENSSEEAAEAKEDREAPCRGDSPPSNRRVRKGKSHQEKKIPAVSLMC